MKNENPRARAMYPHLKALYRQGMNEPDALKKYQDDFPTEFWAALDQIRREQKISQEELSETLNVPVRTLQRWTGQKGRQLTLDFVIQVSLALRLPDELSSLLLESASLRLNMRERRQRALGNILREHWDGGIEKADEILIGWGLEPLRI